MTAQVPERIIVDGSPRALFSQPLYRLLESRRMCFKKEGGGYYTTACYRSYLGTWSVIGSRLYLMHLCTMWPDEAPMPPGLRSRFLRAVPAKEFPVFAHWFNGVLRIQDGRRLVYSHHGWSHWFERERVMHFKGGVLTRDREVDTRRILEWHLRRNPQRQAVLDGTSQAMPVRPLVWFENEKTAADDDADWWPPDYPFRPGRENPR